MQVGYYRYWLAVHHNHQGYLLVVRALAVIAIVIRATIAGIITARVAAMGIAISRVLTGITVPGVTITGVAGFRAAVARIRPRVAVPYTAVARGTASVTGVASVAIAWVCPGIPVTVAAAVASASVAVTGVVISGIAVAGVAIAGITVAGGIPRITVSRGIIFSVVLFIRAFVTGVHFTGMLVLMCESEGNSMAQSNLGLLQKLHEQPRSPFAGWAKGSKWR